MIIVLSITHGPSGQLVYGDYSIGAIKHWNRGFESVLCCPVYVEAVQGDMLKCLNGFLISDVNLDSLIHEAYKQHKIKIYFVSLICCFATRLTVEMTH
jgi:hypothetical protein